MCKTVISKVSSNVIGLMACMAMLIPTLVHAGNPLSQPSDVDLHVAYCLGSEEAVFTNENRQTSTADPFIADVHRRKAQLALSVLDILNLYLDRHLPLVQKVGMDDASRQGFSDAKIALTDPRLSSCFEADAQRAADRLDASVDDRRVTLQRCVAGWKKSFPKVAGCEGLAWLRTH